MAAMRVDCRGRCELDASSPRRFDFEGEVDEAYPAPALRQQSQADCQKCPGKQVLPLYFQDCAPLTSRQDN